MGEMARQAKGKEGDDNRKDEEVLREGPEPICTLEFWNTSNENYVMHKKSRMGREAHVRF